MSVTVHPLALELHALSALARELDAKSALARELDAKSAYLDAGQVDEHRTLLRRRVGEVRKRRAGAGVGPCVLATVDNTLLIKRQSDRWVGVPMDCCRTLRSSRAIRSRRTGVPMDCCRTLLASSTVHL